ncbi:ferrichrome-iron receptor [Klebsiella oxytoca]|nr:ferrichrome-iron receptor [Klebsiella oxytoca]
MGINISGVDFIPRLPDNTHNYTQKWAYSDIENEFGMLRMEYDIVDKWTAYASFRRAARP